MKLHNIGNVAVFRGAPPHDNPYRGGDLSGVLREAMIHSLSPHCPKSLTDGADTSTIQLWLVPSEGGARRIAVNELNWCIYNPMNAACKRCVGNECSRAGKGV